MIGQTLGHYRILEKLGAGGMGVVYRAHDEKLDRDVAIKVLPAEALGDEGARDRLLREARLASKLNHPHICTIHEVGEAGPPAGQGPAVSFIAMELVEGQPLSARLAGGGLPVEQVLRYGQQLADALAHAHDRRVVHRDLKSANIVITPEGRAKILDFGLARRLLGDELADATTATRDSLMAPGMLAGTLAYMAPEQFRGQPADARSDIWALGIVLHEMAAGVRPFQGTTGFELTSAILKEPPAPLPVAVPVPLQAVVGRCLAKDPGERYQRGSDVQAALEAVQAGTAPAGWTARRHTPRRRWLVGLAAAAAAVLVLGLALVALDVGGLRGRFGSRASPKAPAITLAVLPFENPGGDVDQEYFSDGQTLEMVARLARLQPESLVVKARASVMRYKKTEKPPDQIGRELGVDYLLEGSVQREAGRVRFWAELIKVVDQTQVWGNSYDRKEAEIQAVQTEIAQKRGERARARASARRTGAADECADRRSEGLRRLPQRDPIQAGPDERAPGRRGAVLQARVGGGSRLRQGLGRSLQSLDRPPADGPRLAAGRQPRSEGGNPQSPGAGRHRVRGVSGACRDPDVGRLGLARR